MTDPQLMAAIIAGVFSVIAAIVGGLAATGKIEFAGLTPLRKKLPREYVILINGASSVGKTTIAWALARRYKVVSVFGTDILREALRPFTGEKIDKILDASSFLAYKAVDENPTNTEAKIILDGFKRQCEVLLPSIIRVINRTRSKREPVIIEGVNLLSTLIFNEIPNDPFSRIIFVNLFLDDKKEHIARLRQRAEEKGDLPEKTDKYIKNIDQIRFINDFIYEDTATAIKTFRNNIVSIDNSGTVNDAVSKIDGEIKRRLKNLKSKSH